MKGPKNAAALVPVKDEGGADRAGEADLHQCPTVVKSSSCVLACSNPDTCTRNCLTSTPWPINVVDAIDCPADRCIPDRRDCPGECIEVVGGAT